MDGGINGLDGEIKGWMERMDGGMDGWMERWNGWMGARMDRINGWMDGWMDGRMDEWMTVRYNGNVGALYYHTNWMEQLDEGVWIYLG